MLNFAQGMHNNLYQERSSEQAINYCVFKNDNKLLFVLIFWDHEEPSPVAAYSLLFPYCCLSSEVSVSNYCAWNHSYLKKKKRKEKGLYFALFFP